jgi:hypothetical protein
MGVVLGIGATITGFVTDISWLSGFGFASTTFTSLPVLKDAYVSLAMRQKWNWFVRFKSFAEKQAGFDKPVENPWPLSDL